MQGVCLCGSVKVSVSTEAITSFYCHCTICRRFTGSAFATEVMYPPNSVRIEGSTVEFKVTDKYSRHRCCKCGQPIITYSAEKEEFLHLQMLATSIEIPETLKPQMHLWYGNRIVDIKDGLPKFKEAYESEIINE